MRGVGRLKARTAADCKPDAFEMRFRSEAWVADVQSGVVHARAAAIQISPLREKPIDH